MSRKIELIGELFKLGFSFNVVSFIVMIPVVLLATSLGFNSDEMAVLYIIAIPFSLAAWAYIYDYAERKFK